MNRDFDEAEIKMWSLTEPGSGTQNEDAFDIQVHSADPGCLVCVLADGKGGRPGGARAAQVTCQKFMAEALSTVPVKLLKPRIMTGIATRVDRTIFEDPEAGQTTLVAFCIFRNILTGVSNGDSVALGLWADWSTNILTEGQHQNPPVGLGQASLQSFSMKLKTPWMVLAMTDGVWRYGGLDLALSVGVQSPGHEVIERLKEHAIVGGGGRLQDDFSLIVLKG